MKYWLIGFFIGISACGSNQEKETIVVPELNKQKKIVESETPSEKEQIMESIDKNSLVAPKNVAAAPTDAITTLSGLSYIVLREGMGGDSPTLTASVTAHYTGWQTDGKMFDSSVERGEPFTAPLNRLIKGWQEGMGMMTKGEKRRFWIPAGLAYGENPRPGAPSGMLVFDVELIDFKAQ